MDKFTIKRALISVHNKTGLTDLVAVLQEKGIEILSSGGTAEAIRKAGYQTIDISEYTASGEIFGGRVKTLHPKIHGGILMRRDNQNDILQAQKAGIEPIDLVVVDLYPFRESVTEETPEAEATELIDIGGVALLRAGAKNFKAVAVLCSTTQYGDFIKALKSEEGLTREFRTQLANEAFLHTAQYDMAIGNYFAGKAQLYSIFGQFHQALRYGENPHQKATWYSLSSGGLSSCRQLWGKELSYLNVLDLDSAYNISRDFDELCCVIIKHTTPCGLALGNTTLEAYERAFACDTRSPFGGIVGFNREVDAETAEEMNKIFLEVIMAPSFSERALAILKSKKNLRLLEWGGEGQAEKKFVSIGGGFLVQESDSTPIRREDFTVVTKLHPTEEQWTALTFGVKAAKWAKSNAVVLCNEYQTLGIGCGQTSRVGAVEIAVTNATMFGHSLQGAVMASDAFFPFPDSVEEASRYGISAVAQPGGSVKDEEVIKKADELKMAMVFTGKRHFRH
jgi:phosphoribosylaminoimidazolecarboxamide formyltransferase/IMP cyclohydrolase